MRRCGLLLVFLILLARVPAARGRVEPEPVLEVEPGPAYAIADEQFVTGTLRDQEAVERFLETEESALSGVELEPVPGKPMAAPAAIAFLGEAYSVSPSLLLTLAEMEHQVLSGETMAPAFPEHARWLARILSRWFYDYYYRVGAAREGGSPELNAGNAGTYALRTYFNTHVYGTEAYPRGTRRVQAAAWEQALATTYARYFGSLWAGRLVARRPAPSAYASLPLLALPWTGQERWYFTGGPHSFDGSNRLPLSGVDFQPEGYGGCNPPLAAECWVAAAARGQVIGSLDWWVKLDHDYDGDATSGWQTVYGHLAEVVVAGGERVIRGQPLGSPSCYGGFASGVHVHFGVKYENVWQPIMDFPLSGWAFERGEESYEGWMLGPDGAERRACFDSETGLYDCSQGVLTLPSNEIPPLPEWEDGARPE